MLAAEHDAARANMGGEWRMPTIEELQALVDNTTSTWRDTFGGTKGRIFKGKGDYASSSLFLPAAGEFVGTSYYFGGSGGFYLSSTLFDSSGNIILAFSRVGGEWDYDNLFYYGHSVRAVRAVPVSE